mgnify:CR=1 FL=1
MTDPASLTIDGYTDEQLQARAKELADAHYDSRRALADALDVAPSSLHQALEGPPTGRLRKLRIRVVEHLSGQSLHPVTVIAVEGS